MKINTIDIEICVTSIDSAGAIIECAHAGVCDEDARAVVAAARGGRGGGGRGGAPCAPVVAVMCHAVVLGVLFSLPSYLYSAVPFR